MDPNKSKEKKELEELNDRLAVYIEKIKNQASNREYELPSIHDLVKEQMSALWSEVEKEKVKTEDLARYKKRLETEEERRKRAEDQVDDLITERIKAELDRDYQMKRNELLQEEIKSLKNIYEKKICELQRQRQENLTEEDASKDELKKALQELREQEKRITLGEQKKKMEKMAEQFEKMMENLSGYEEAINNKLDLNSEIENYEMLLEKMKKRVDLKKEPGPKVPNTEPPKPPKPPKDGGEKKEPTPGQKANPKVLPP